MFSKIKSSLSNLNTHGFLNLLLLAFFVYFIYSYFLKLNYVFNGDEILYLADSLLLLEGIRPSYSHSPSGISTWLGSSGLYWSVSKWCSILNKKDTAIIIPTQNEITNCEDVN